MVAIPLMPLAHAIEVNALTLDDAAGATLSATLVMGSHLIDDEAVRDLAQRWFAALKAMVRHVAQPGAGGHTPSDLPLVALSQTEIERLESRYLTSRRFSALAVAGRSVVPCPL